METNAQKLYQEFCLRFRTLTDADLIALFNHEVTQQGWGTARAAFLGALHQQFIDRDFDYSSIGDVRSLSLLRPVKLDGKVIIRCN